jgi:dienelactone hydrolase
MKLVHSVMCPVRRLGMMAVASLLWVFTATAVAAQPQEVSFASLDGTPIKAWVFRPTANKPNGTVVALHGCGGLYATSGARQGRLNARHQAMAEMLLVQGYAVVFPDSLTPRGLTQLCTVKLRNRSVSQIERRSDALAALNWVATQPWATPSKMALIGWSHGGSAVLSSTDARQPEVATQAAKPAVAIAFYPGCADARKTGYQPSTRLLLMVGALDDWTPPGPCIELGQGVGAEVNVYAESYHDFDNPVGGVTLRSDVPNGVHPGRGVHVGANPVAREQAYGRLRDALRTAFE